MANWLKDGQAVSSTRGGFWLTPPPQLDDFGYGFQIDKVVLIDSGQRQPTWAPWWGEKRLGQGRGREYLERWQLTSH